MRGLLTSTEYVPDIHSSKYSTMLWLFANKGIPLPLGSGIHSVVDEIVSNRQKRDYKLETIHFRSTHVFNTKRSFRNVWEPFSSESVFFFNMIDGGRPNILTHLIWRFRPTLRNKERCCRPCCGIPNSNFGAVSHFWKVLMKAKLHHFLRSLFSTAETHNSAPVYIV